jgi:hypothetical protein
MVTVFLTMEMTVLMNLARTSSTVVQIVMAMVSPTPRMIAPANWDHSRIGDAPLPVEMEMGESHRPLTPNLSLLFLTEY